MIVPQQQQARVLIAGDNRDAVKLSSRRCAAAREADDVSYCSTTRFFSVASRTA